MPTARPTCAIVSFRLGRSDGVSVVAAAWERALQQLGWRTVTVAGDGVADHLIPALGIDGPELGHQDLVAAVTDAVADADVVLVENLLTIPMNLAASRAVAEVLTGRAAVLHHHDPPWQRDRFVHITELPPDDPNWTHITINRLTERQFADRGLTATTIYNGFDPTPPGDRRGTRARLGIDDDQWLFAHPVRAIARKNIPAAIDLCQQLGAVYWLPGPAEEGYGDELATVIDRAGCPVLRVGLAQLDATVADLYAAADLVLFPSTWEGFGNPPVEAALHRRPVVVGPYPVADELRTLGFRWLPVDDPTAVRAAVAATAGQWPPNDPTLDHNHAVARTHLSTEAMTEQLRAVFNPLGWGS